jgi:CBS domain containing-hemolysin-like protein
VLLIVIALALVAACGVFVAAEFSFVTVDRSSVERAAEQGDRGAQGVQSALRRLSTNLSAAQVGITITNLLIGYMAEPSIAHLIDGPLASIGLSENLAEVFAVIIALVLATVFTMVFGELVPKNLAIAQPLATAKATQRFQRGFSRVAGPAIKLLNGSANALLGRFGIEPQEELASARSPEELMSLVRRSAEQGTLEVGTAALVARSLAFGERNAGDVMTPRALWHTIEPDQTVADVIALARTTGRSRFPVFEEATEHLEGVVHLKQAVGVPREERETTLVRDIMNEAVVVPTSLDLDSLLAMLRDGGLQIAVVVDEYGGVDGLVTLEDLVEEIVGEVRDEHDDPGDDRVRRDGDVWDLSGLLRPDEATEALGGVRIPEDEEYETLAGLLALRLARVPGTGDHATIETRDRDGKPYAVTLTVTAMDDLRVDRVRVELERLPEPTEDDEQ